MLTGIVITLLITSALGYALGSGRHGELIAHRPYNNRYDDASAARQSHLG